MRLSLIDNSAARLVNCLVKLLAGNAYGTASYSTPCSGQSTRLRL
ncbi:MAG: hypothetical protein PUI29_05860 [Aeromonadales bacterium]|nr:hypothetical protein [Aeromonadales bacterium]MDY2890543.1 hypothetical protein [Succinivibrio sp.]